MKLVKRNFFEFSSFRVERRERRKAEILARKKQKQENSDSDFDSSSGDSARRAENINPLLLPYQSNKQKMEMDKLVTMTTAQARLYYVNNSFRNWTKEKGLFKCFFYIFFFVLFNWI